jgi:pimeloyl-ACP methyl ester carboxylesterase
MQRRLTWVLAALAVLLVGHTAAAAARPSISPPKPIEDFFDVTLGGVRQKVLVQGKDARRPILLWLHGGPGSSAMLLSHAYTQRLRNHFIVVNWDQRGAGLSYEDGMDPGLISEENIVRDTVALTEELLRRYAKRKVFLLGHSFGSVIGVRVARYRPDLFYAYVGMGQVVDFERSRTITARWLERKLLEAHADEDLARLRAEGVSADLTRKHGAYFHTPVDMQAIMRASPYFVDGYLERLARSREFSGEHMKSDGSLRAAEGDPKRFKIPVFFFEGRHDHVMACAPELVIEFAETLAAPRKRILWFERSAHHPNLEEPERFQDLLIKYVLPLAGQDR